MCYWFPLEDRESTRNGILPRWIVQYHSMTVTQDPPPGRRRRRVAVFNVVSTGHQSKAGRSFPRSPVPAAPPHRGSLQTDMREIAVHGGGGQLMKHQVIVQTCQNTLVRRTVHQSPPFRRYYDQRPSSGPEDAGDEIVHRVMAGFRLRYRSGESWESPLDSAIASPHRIAEG